METTQDALTDRVAQLEKKVEEGVTVVAAAPGCAACFGQCTCHTTETERTGADAESNPG